ncbi:MAG: 50S ribosomal protein L9 [Thermomicrobiaceae bacterium]
MKVILVQDVPNVGESGSIQNVSDGFARNYLIPQGLAEMGTPGRIKQAEQRLQAQQRKVERQEEELRDLSERIEGLRVEIEARVGRQGRLFGSINAPEIANAVSTALGEEIDRRRVELPDPIRSIGEHAVEIHLVGRLRPTVTVTVKPSADSIVETESSEDDSSESDEPVEQESTAGSES